MSKNPTEYLKIVLMNKKGMEHLPFAFLGIDECKDPKAAIIPVPYESTTSYGSGTRFGPQAIIEASRYMEDYEMEENYAVSEISTLPLKAFSIEPNKMCAELKSVVANELAEGRWPIVLGGEHTISFGALQAWRKKIDVVVLDAHMDFRDRFENAKLCHATVMRRVSELEHIGKIVWIGTRAISEEEAFLIEEKGLNVYPAFSKIPLEDMVKSLRQEIYISIDLDVLKPEVMPSVGTPEPGGLSWEELVHILRFLFQQKHVVGCDVVELSPIPALRYPDFLAARLVQKLLCFHFKWLKKSAGKRI